MKAIIKLPLSLPPSLPLMLISCKLEKQENGDVGEYLNLMQPAAFPKMNLPPISSNFFAQIAKRQLGLLFKYTNERSKMKYMVILRVHFSRILISNCAEWEIKSYFMEAITSDYGGD